MAWSTVPAALDALVQTLRAEPELSGIVRDGPELRDAADLEVVFVGYTGPDDDTAVEGAASHPGLAVRPDRESYSIRCAASVLNGASDIHAARARVYELLSMAADAIAADHTLGGVVMQARPGEWTLSLQQTADGALASVAFSVDVEAFTL